MSFKNNLIVIAVFIGILGRIAFWIGLIFITGHAALHFSENQDYVMTVFSILFFPLTFFIYPWFSGLWWVFLISIIGYGLSTFIGKLPPVE